MIENDIQLFFRDPIRKLLASVNQSSYLIYFYYNFFDRAKETNTYKLKSRRLCSLILTCFYFYSLNFKKNHGFIEEGNPSEKVVTFERELDGIDIDDIRNLEDLLRLCSLMRNLGISE